MFVSIIKDNSQQQYKSQIKFSCFYGHRKQRPIAKIPIFSISKIPVHKYLRRFFFLFTNIKNQIVNFKFHQKNSQYKMCENIFLDFHFSLTFPSKYSFSWSTILILIALYLVLFVLRRYIRHPLETSVSSKFSYVIPGQLNGPLVLPLLTCIMILLAEHTSSCYQLSNEWLFWVVLLFSFCTHALAIFHLLFFQFGL